MKTYSREYGKNLQHTMGIRLSPQLREEAEAAAKFHGMSFSTFLRQSLRRNITLSKTIEEEVARRSFRAAAGNDQ
jgi:predicted HicB family RNase H-like nuclease